MYRKIDIDRFFFVAVKELIYYIILFNILEKDK